MFEIGTTLREARVRRKLTLQQVEEDTKIRVKYLQAMENEDFDIMPGKAYVKGFLHTYATYLGLDATIILDEYRSRLMPRDEHQPFSGSSVIGKPHSHRRRNTLAFIAVVCLLVLAVIVVLGYTGGPVNEPTVKTSALGLGSPSPSVKPSVKPTVTPTVATDIVRVSAAKGDCWFEARKGSSTGTVMYAGLLQRGKTKVLHAATLWLRLGAPAAVSIRAGTKRLPALTGTGPLDVIIEDGVLTKQG